MGYLSRVKEEQVLAGPRVGAVMWWTGVGHTLQASGKDPEVDLELDPKQSFSLKQKQRVEYMYSCILCVYHLCPTVGFYMQTCVSIYL